MLLILGVSGCSESDSQSPASAPKTPAKATSPPASQSTSTGAITVRVTYAGPPDVETLRINKDVEQCSGEATVAWIVVGEGKGLVNAVASVAGLEGPRTSRTPQLDQRGCQFRPHVLAMHTGEIEILNSDGIFHNVHTYSEANPSINKA